jgi:regulatory protein
VNCCCLSPPGAGKKPRRPKLPAPETDNERDPALHEAAVRLLARREHAAGELAAKLEQRGYDRASIAAEIERLAAEGLQSDERFATLFVEQRAGRGDGPVKLRAALGDRGVDGATIDSALAPFEEEWTTLAREALVRRFGVSAPATRAEQSKRMRFLQGRGFPAGMIRRVIDYDNADE